MSLLVPWGSGAHLGEYNGSEITWGDISSCDFRVPEMLAMTWVKEFFDDHVRQDMKARFGNFDEISMLLVWLRIAVKERIPDWDVEKWSKKIIQMFILNR